MSDNAADDLRRWLDGLGLGRYVEAFIANDIDMEVLADLTAADLEALGVSLGHRKKLSKAIAALASRALTDGDGPRPQATAIGARELAGVERRQLTVMFCDLVGSTALSASMDVEEYRDLLGAYQSRTSREIAAYEGYIARYMGDGLLVYFGYPQAHEDDAERALRAALAIVAAMADLAAAHPTGLEVRIGIATGPVVAGDIVGEGASEERAVLGDTPNLAARLQALARPGEILLSDATRALTGRLFVCEDLGRREISGLPVATRIWRLLSGAVSKSRFAATRSPERTPLIGRHSELQLLLDRWQRATDSEGQVVLISGEPGIGKSRLVHALGDHIRAQRCDTLWFQCSPYHANSAYFPFIDHIEREAGIEPGASGAEQFERLRRWLAASGRAQAGSAALLAALLSIPGQRLGRQSTLTPKQQKEQTVRVVEQLVVDRAHQGPLLMLFEDVHWADPTSLDVIGRLIGAIAESPVLLVITHRPEFTPPWQGHGNLTAHSLARLGRRQVADIVAGMVDGRNVPERVLIEIVRKTDGVPLFVEELTKAVVEAGLFEQPDSFSGAETISAAMALPSTLRDSLTARLDRLARAKPIAQIAAVIGRDFSYELLAALAPVEPTVLTGALLELEQAGLIHRHGEEREAAFRFKHALIQDAAYESLLKRQRQQLHARVARELEAKLARTASQEPELLAHHFAAAGLVERAVHYRQRAAQRAIERSAYRETLAHFDAGLALLETQPEASRDRQVELELQIGRGGALLPARGYRAPETEAAFARASALAQLLGDARHGFAAMRALHGVHFARAEVDAALAAAQRCVELAEHDGDAQRRMQHRSVAQRMVGQTYFLRGALAQAHQHLSAAAALDAEAASGEVAALVHGGGYRLMIPAFLAQVLWLQGFPDRALVTAQRAVEQAEARYGAFSVTACLFFLCWIRGWRQDYDAVAELAARIQRLTHDHEIAEFGATGYLLADWPALATAEPAKVDELARARLASVRTLSGVMTPFRLGLLAQALIPSGIDHGLAIIDEALALGAATGERWSDAELMRIRGEALLRVGDIDGAEACLQQSLAVAREQGARSWELRTATSLSRIWHDRGRADDARHLLAPIVAGFDEGHGSGDYRRAAALLAALRD